MSLRDQLLKKGLVSKKDARRTERELKKQRKQEQAQRRRKHELEAEARARAEAEREATLHEARQRRLEREEAKAQQERALQIRNLILGNRIRSSGNQPFWHRSLDGRQLLRASVHPAMAEKLRRGELAIAALNHGNRVEYVLVPRRAAQRLDELAPRLLVHFTRETEGLGAPDEAVLQRDWEPSLAPHRATPDDLARLGAT